MPVIGVFSLLDHMWVGEMPQANKHTYHIVANWHPPTVRFQFAFSSQYETEY